MPTQVDLARTLERIDGRGYKAYKDLRGSYTFDDFTLYIDYVQGDPFASPSKLRVRVPQEKACLPPTLFATHTRAIALADALCRELHKEARSTSQRRGSGKSGAFFIDAGGQEVLQRSAVILEEAFVEARLEVGLPAAGRKVLGRQANAMFCHDLPQLVHDTLLWDNLPQKHIETFVECVENQEHIRALLHEHDLLAFVANGSLLPRESGATDLPLRSTQAVLFQSPPSLEISFEVPNPIAQPDGPSTTITGMGIPQGITLIVGGGYHGKSTLLRAIERCVYPHIPGDGREYVVARHDLFKIRAEDGRRVQGVDISPFINNLPYGRDTRFFCSDNASGSTSQAANIIEAIEAGAHGLLLDEDTSATNFMIRDARMQTLVQKEHEPITPLLDRIRSLYTQLDVSTILVIGGCGDYFDVADTVILMRDYLPHDATTQALQIAQHQPSLRHQEPTTPLQHPTPRIPVAASFDPSKGRRDIKISTKAHDLILFGEHPIELRCVEQLVDPSQTRAIGFAIQLAASRFMTTHTTLHQILDAIEDFFDQHGLDPLDPYHRKEQHPGRFARPRRLEIAAAINRLRTAQFQPHNPRSGP